MVEGGEVTEFKWAFNSSGLAYLADQAIDGKIELFGTLPDGSKRTKLSGSLIAEGDVVDFAWVPETPLTPQILVLYKR
jgi:hypothetical protein